MEDIDNQQRIFSVVIDTFLDRFAIVDVARDGKRTTEIEGRLNINVSDIPQAIGQALEGYNRQKHQELRDLGQLIILGLEETLEKDPELIYQEMAIAVASQDLLKIEEEYRKVTRRIVENHLIRLEVLKETTGETYRALKELIPESLKLRIVCPSCGNEEAYFSIDPLPNYCSACGHGPINSSDCYPAKKEFSQILGSLQARYLAIEEEILPHGGTPLLTKAIYQCNTSVVEEILSQLPEGDREKLKPICDRLLNQ